MKHSSLSCSLARQFRLTLCLLLILPALCFAQNTLNLLFGSVEDFLRTQTQGLPGKVSIRIDPLDPSTQLTPCSAFDHFLPAGSPPWGKTTIGVRCLGPSSWTVYLQARIKVHGKYLVAAHALTAGQVVEATDIADRNGDLSTLPTTVLTDPAQAIGKKVKLGIVSGHPLRSEQLIAPWAVQQGQNVKTLSHGPGFSVSSEGKALNNATEGQVVQVRTPSGQTVSGIARTGGIVEVTH